MAEAIAQDIATIARIDAIPSILQIACTATGLRFAAVARVTETTWTACAVRDEIAFGFMPGGELEIESTICNEIRDSGETVAIDEVSSDNRFRDHLTPRRYGFQSYISVPIIRRDGRFFGTLCALDPLPARVTDTKTITMFESFAQLIALQLDEQDALAESSAALSEASDTAELREKFIAILGHDLRNPVAAIQAGTTLLAKAPLDNRSSRIVTQMRLSCQRISDMIEDILDFARGRLGSGLVLDQSPAIDLDTSLQQVVDELQVVHADRQIDFYLDLAETVTCDAERITQLLSNLLANALTHGSPDMPVSVSATSGAGEFRLSVENAGLPIPASSIQNLFQPFTRSAEGKSPAGLGLGLFIASEIAKAHQGSLDVNSDENQTSFQLRMPCDCAA
jgi:signal transduction histidine kinase